MITFCLGYMGFASVTFWLALYMQEIKNLSALMVAVQLLPMVVNGVLVNVVCGLILHKVSNKLLMAIGAVSYTAALLILSFLKVNAPYWAFIFPGLILVVVGADIEFNVVNVSIPTYVLSLLRYLHSIKFFFILLADYKPKLDVRHVLPAIVRTICCRWDLQHYLQTVQQYQSGYLYCCLQRRQNPEPRHSYQTISVNLLVWGRYMRSVNLCRPVPPSGDTRRSRLPSSPC